MYHQFQASTVDPLDHATIERRYEEGYVFTRLGNTIMHQVRSVRVPLHEFHASSENRRVQRMHAALTLQHVPLSRFTYHWKMGKMAKNFYDQFGVHTFSANKMKELITRADSSMNAIIEYRTKAENPCGYCILFEAPTLVHYAYPFYRLGEGPSLGMAMMTLAVLWAHEQGKEYIYLGSIQSEKSLYKFQFKGVEWFNGQDWRKDKPTVQEIIESEKQSNNLFS